MYIKGLCPRSLYHLDLNNRGPIYNFPTHQKFPSNLYNFFKSFPSFSPLPVHLCSLSNVLKLFNVLDLFHFLNLQTSQDPTLSRSIFCSSKMGVACIMASMRLRRVKEWQENDERRWPEHEARMQEYEERFQEHWAQFKEHKMRFQQQRALFQKHEARFRDHNAQIQDHMAQMKQWREHDARLRRWRERNTRILEGKNPVAHWFREKANAILIKMQSGFSEVSSESSDWPKSSSIQPPLPPLSQFSFQIGSQTQSTYVAGISEYQTQPTFIGLCSRPSSADAIPGSFAWGWPFIYANVTPRGKRCSAREVSERDGKQLQKSSKLNSGKISKMDFGGARVGGKRAKR